MTTEPTTPATTPTAPEAPAKKTPAPRRKAAPKAPAEFAPKVNDKGRLDHGGCGHPRDMKGRTACRAWYAQQQAKK